jgi:hypothetical protein
MFRLSHLLLGVSAASAHFVLKEPGSLGYSDVLEGNAPCGGVDVKGRENAHDWPIGGSQVHVLTTHARAVWTYKAALSNDTETWVDLIPAVSQNKGYGDFCLPSVPGPTGWVGLKGVIQVVQIGPDGSLYQVWPL